MLDKYLAELISRRVGRFWKTVAMSVYIFGKASQLFGNPSGIFGVVSEVYGHKFCFWMTLNGRGELV